MTAAPSGVTAAVSAGTRLFNRGRYVEAHETWEAAWRDAPVEDRGFLEALIQLATGMHLRVARGATRGAVNLLGQSLVGLDDYRPAAHGVDVETLVGEVGAFVEWLRKVQRPHRALDGRRVPRIQPCH